MEEKLKENKLKENKVDAGQVPTSEGVVPEKQEVLKVYLEGNRFGYETNLSDPALKALLRDIIDELTLREFEARMIQRAKAVAELQKKHGSKLWTPGTKLDN